MMNGYSKMRPTGTTHRSRSVDFSDLLSFPAELPERHHRISNLNNTSGSGEAAETEHTSKIKTDNPDKIPELTDDFQYPVPEPEKPEKGEIFGVVLSRSSSVCSKRFSRFEKQGIGAQCSAVKRAFSMRRSSSVSERYCRIHDQSVTLAPHMDEEEDGTNTVSASARSLSNKKKSKGGKILKTCRRILGL